MPRPYGVGARDAGDLAIPRGQFPRKQQGVLDGG